MKLDLHDLVSRRLQWDDQVPDNLRHVWLNHFEMMKEMKQIKFQRAVVPEDAISDEINTLSFGDASNDLVCVAIYVRFKCHSGKYSCQLVFGRSRLVPNGMSQPRAELYAALVNTHSTEVVKKAFYKHHTFNLYFTDSQIVLYWICNDAKALKSWVRNRIIDIRRYSDTKDWRYIQSHDMVADIGTRRGVSIDDVKPGSIWINGLPWMSSESNEFPALTVEEINLNTNQMVEAKKECSLEYDDTVFVQRQVPDDVRSRYLYSKYLLDSNKYRFYTVVRIMALVIKFIRMLQHRVKQT